jgi:hypothetical protein
MDDDRELSHEEISALQASIVYSKRHCDDAGVYEYRTVLVPRDVWRRINGRSLLSEPEWRACGLRMSRGWEHYGYFGPDRMTLLFRRRLVADTTKSSHQ